MCDYMTLHRKAEDNPITFFAVDVFKQFCVDKHHLSNISYR